MTSLARHGMNNDGKADLVWRQTQTGAVALWKMNAAGGAQSTILSGSVPLAWQVAEVLDINGITCLLGVTPGHRHADIASDRLNSDLVLGNRLIFGSVNAHRRDFERGVEDLLKILGRWPDALEKFIGRRLPLERFREAVDGDPAGVIKTVLEVT